MDKYCAITTDPANFEELRATLEPLGFVLEFTASVPLAGVVAAEAIEEPLRAFLAGKAIRTAGDLDRLRLDDLVTAPGVTRQALTRFVRELARSERYPDPDALQDFMVRRGIFI